MPSIVPDYEYDIFISYRQKDNKGDRWVSEFVEALKTELESTFKEEISVYFDINPHDGLLETHDVDASLKEKLKCLVFVPIISQTYCDPKSYAWQSEFVAFNKIAKEDQFGRDIRLIGGNVASRILPVKIHDLDLEDKTLLENELGRVLRGIEFIFKSSGVNRPLKPSDNPDKNLNKTYYPDQINKVANAVKEIITAIKKYNQQDGEVPKEVVKEKTEKPIKLKLILILGAFLILVILTLGYLFNPKHSKSYVTIKKSIAVLPFENMSDDIEHSWFGDAMTDEIIMQLFKIKEFTVRSRPSVMQYKGTAKTSPVIGKELNVNYLIGGSAQRFEDQVKIRVQLINAATDNPLWGDTFEGKWEDILTIQSEIAKQIAEKLKIVLSPEEIIRIDKKPTENLEAYNNYLQGNYYYWKSSGMGELSTSIELYQKAIRLDPGFALAFTGIAKCFLDQYWNYQDHSEEILHKSKEAIDKAFAIEPGLSDAHLALGIYYYHGYMNYPEALKEFEQVLEDQPKNPEVIYWSAAVHRRAGNWEMAKSEFEKAVELNPGRSDIAGDAGETFDLIRNYSKAEEYYNMSLMLQPDWVITSRRLSQMYLRWEGDMRKAREILGNAARNNKSFLSDSLIIETNVLIDIYEGKYEDALKEISLFKFDVIQTEFYFRPKYLYNASIYGLMNKPELEHAYYDSARIFLEKRIIDFPDDQRLYSSLGIAYAGLGLDYRAISRGEKAVKLLPVSKEAWKGVYLVEDLALIYVMVGKYDDAIKQIKYLLSIPGFLSPKILEIDPRWAPLRNRPEFKKMMESYSGK
jgi:TolB-like protein/TPR repeat protein